MQPDLEALHTAMTRVERGRGKQYPPELRNQIVETAQLLRSGGWTWSAIGEALGMPRKAVSDLVDRWAGRTADSEMKRVQIAAHPDESPGEPGASVGKLTIVSPNGWRIEGLGLADAAALLAKLPC